MANKRTNDIDNSFDEYALITILISRLTKRRKELISELKSQMTINKPRLTKFNCITYTSIIVGRVDLDAIRNEIGEDLFETFKVDTNREELAVTSLDGTDVKIKNAHLDINEVERMISGLIKERKK